MNKCVCILNFSSRDTGNCAHICDYIRQQTGGTVYNATFAPCGGCDYECLKPGLHCPKNNHLNAVLEAVTNSSLTYFVLPNYCGGPCANYWAFNERSVGYFDGQQEKLEQYLNRPKRFVIVSNTEGFETAMQQQVSCAPKILYLKSKAYGKRSIDGNILESAQAKADLSEFIVRPL